MLHVSIAMCVRVGKHCCDVFWDGAQGAVFISAGKGCADG